MKFSSCLRQALLSFPGGGSDKECRRLKRLGFDPWVRKIPWRSACQPIPVSLENPLDRGAWQVTVHGVAKNQIQLKQLITHLCLVK